MFENFFYTKKQSKREKRNNKKIKIQLVITIWEYTKKREEKAIISGPLLTQNNKIDIQINK